MQPKTLATIKRDAERTRSAAAYHQTLVCCPSCYREVARVFGAQATRYASEPCNDCTTAEK